MTGIPLLSEPLCSTVLPSNTMIWNFHIMTKATIAYQNPISSPCAIVISPFVTNVSRMPMFS